jgi:uncharacterized membrane protein
MKPFALLVIVFGITSAISKFAIGNWNMHFAGNLAMFLMLCLTASGHFMFKKGMALMIPPVIPFKTQLVFITGIAEIILGLCLLFPTIRVDAGYALIIFFLLILPANIYSAIKHINIEKGTYDGPGLTHLWFRIPLQLFFIAWIYYFSVR